MILLLIYYDLVYTDTLSSCFSHKCERGNETSRHSKTMQSSTHTDLEIERMKENLRNHDDDECALDKDLCQRWA